MTGSRMKMLFFIYMHLYSMVMISGESRETGQGISYSNNPGDKRDHLRTLAKLQCGLGKPVDRNTTRNRAEPGEFPFNVIVKSLSGKGDCEGVLINEQYILTAAHCLIKRCTSASGNPMYKHPKELQVVLGDHSTAEEDGEMPMNVSRIFPHPDYHCRKHNDIAVLRLAQPVSLEITNIGYGSINKVCLNSAHHGVGEKLIVTGWDQSESDIMQMAHLESIENSYCEKNITKFDKDKQICVDGIESFGGSLGGPVVHQRKDGHYDLVGLVPYNREAWKNPAAYTRVEHFRPWINEKMQTH